MNEATIVREQRSMIGLGSGQKMVMSRTTGESRLQVRIEGSGGWGIFTLSAEALPLVIRELLAFNGGEK